MPAYRPFPVLSALLAASVLGVAPMGRTAESAAGWTVEKALRQPAEWFETEEARRILGTVLAHQSPAGSWPKNLNTAAEPKALSPEERRGTFDNGATTRELRLMARAFAATQEPAYRESFLRGLGAVLDAQYPTGGWPQFHPAPADTYHRHVTYNDSSMLRLLELLREVEREPLYRFVPAETLDKVRSAFRRGLDCIVKSQIRVEGRLTVWCAQHDPETLEPRSGRSYELVSLSGAESAGLLVFLMSLDDPSPEIVRAVQAGVRWFEESKITGLKEVRIDGDKRMVPDASAPPLWARFYEIGDNRPIFSGRDGVKKHDVADIEAERRNGYSWYGRWGEAVAQRHADWARNWPTPATGP
jgi:pectate lyase